VCQVWAGGLYTACIHVHVGCSLPDVLSQPMGHTPYETSELPKHYIIQITQVLSTTAINSNQDVLGMNHPIQVNGQGQLS
jgi:hypothetical protein